MLLDLEISIAFFNALSILVHLRVLPHDPYQL